MLPAHRVSRFQESMIREMTRLALQHGAINLSQGYPDFAAPTAVREAAKEAIESGLNQYTVTWGYPPLRQRLAEIYAQRLGWPVQADVHVTVTCGVTEAINAALLAVLNPGDEIVILEPAHENFRPAAIFAGAEPVTVPLAAPDYRLDAGRLAAAISPRTRALLLNTPHNPTGRVFDAVEMAAVVDLVTRHDLILITDEIYDNILYDGRQHICPGSLEPLRDRTITISGMGKTFAVTGWRVGYIVAPPALAGAVRAVHDYLTICAPTPLQAAALAALDLPATYFTEMTSAYHQRRDLMVELLDALGFSLHAQPEGAYYMLVEYDNLPIPQAAWPSLAFARWLTTEVGVAVVPGSHFYTHPGYGEHTIRFAFPKQLATLHAAGERLRRGLAPR